MSREAVAYVLRMFPQASETFVANEILALERLGLPIRVYSYRRPYAAVHHRFLGRLDAPVSYLPDPLYRHPRALARACVELRRFEPRRYADTVRYVAGHARRERNPDTWRRFLQAAALARALRETDVGHLHAHFAHGATRVAMLASMLTGLPFSFTAHARDIFSDDVDWPLFAQKLERARFAVTVSRFNRAYIRERLGRPGGRVHVVYNGVDLDRFSPGLPDEREEGLVVGIGRLVPKKGFPVLVEACRLLRDRGRSFRCEIVGDGELRDDLASRIEAARLRGLVRLVGPRTHEDLEDVYRRASVVVMPAITDGDGNRDALPTVLLEAFASGTPAVASRLTGIPEIVDHGENGFLVPPGDAPALADALERLLESPDLRERFGQAAREKAENRFDLRANTAELFRLLTGGAGGHTAHETDAIRVPVH